MIYDLLMSEDNQTVADAEPDADEENALKVVTYKTPTGQSVIISQAALDTYGTDYINQAALSTGKNRIVFADEDVLEDAQERFPDSDHPIIDAYSDYLIDHRDVMPLLNGVNPETDKPFEGDETTEFQTQIDKHNNDELESKITSNSPAATAQPNGDAAFIVIPSPSSLEDDSFKKRIQQGLTGITDENAFAPSAGNSMDWAKFTVSHEIGHVVNGHAQHQYEAIVDALETKSINSASTTITKSRITLDGEIEADISAARDFNKVTGGIPPLPQAFADLRVISSFLSDDNIVSLGGNATSLNEHNTGNALQDYLEGKGNHVSADREQFVSAYSNTLVNGLVGAVEGEKNFKALPYTVVLGYEDGPLKSQNRMMSRDDFHSSLKGNDPTDVVMIGTNNNTPSRVYAATKALLEHGDFDHSPDAKRNAERFITAVERSTPGIVKEQEVNEYKKALENPANADYIGQLQRYNNPESKIGYLYQPSPAAPAPAQ